MDLCNLRVNKPASLLTVYDLAFTIDFLQS